MSGDKSDKSTSRKKRSTIQPDYYTEETQFSLSWVSTSIYNTAPRLTGPVTVTMTEDEGIYKILFNKYKMSLLMGSV